MSMAPLLGVPGKLKTLLDRITTARAANLDNIDAAVSSRAPSATALSTATWTNARAANIDEILTDTAALDGRLTATRAGYLDAAITSRLSTVITRSYYGYASPGAVTSHTFNLGATFDRSKCLVSASAVNEPGSWRWSSASSISVYGSSNDGFTVNVVEFA